MDERKGLASELAKGSFAGHQSLPKTDAAFRGFPQQDALMLFVADQLDRDFLLLDLIDDGSPA